MRYGTLDLCISTSFKSFWSKNILNDISDSSMFWVGPIQIDFNNLLGKNTSIYGINIPALDLNRTLPYIGQEE